MPKFYITTPIYYVNDVPHIGHAYTTLAADVLARYRRLSGWEVFFLTGTDEHGAKVSQAARKKGLAPEIFCKQVAGDFKKLWKVLGVNYDRFIRTTERIHEDVVQAALQKLYESGFLYKGEYKGLYCTGCEAFKLPADLVDGNCPDHLSRPEEVKEENWFFRLSSFQEALQAAIERNEFQIWPEIRKNEILGFLKQGLEDVSISRPNQPWGIALPFDPRHTTYVWIDALLNYLSGVGFADVEKGGWSKPEEHFQLHGKWGSAKHKSWEHEPSATFKKFWPPDVQLMAKDILKFHGVIWPALLLALELPLPKVIFAHGYFTVAGQKMSKTIGNIVDPKAIVKKFGADPLRYFLFREFPFGEDGDFSEEKLADRYKYDLANDLGNLLHRVVSLAAKNFAGKVPVLAEERVSNLESAVVLDTWRKIEEKYEKLNLQGVLNDIWELIQFANRRIDEKKPWSLKVERKSAKGSKAIYSGELPEIIYEMLEILRHLAFMVYPFMPETADKILFQLGLGSVTKTKLEYDQLKQWGGLKMGTKLRPAGPLFPKLDMLA